MLKRIGTHTLGLRALLDSIIKKWSSFHTPFGAHITVHVADFNAGITAYLVWQDKLIILKHFNGSASISAPAGTTPVTVTVLTGAQLLLQQSYDALKESLFDAFLVQAQIRLYLDAVELRVIGSGVAANGETFKLRQTVV